MARHSCTDHTELVIRLQNLADGPKRDFHVGIRLDTRLFTKLLRMSVRQVLTPIKLHGNDVAIFCNFS